MARLEVLTYPDPRLRLSAAPVTTFGGDLERFIDDLIETMTAAGAIGLSATQVGDGRNVLVIDPPGEDNGPLAYVNAQIGQKTAWGFVQESCLSVPGIKGSVIRATALRVLAKDRHGAPIDREVSGMHAVCLQHETDHLAGKLFIDKFSMLGRLRVRLKTGISERRDGKTMAATA